LLYWKSPEEATNALLSASPPLRYRAIDINLKLFRWEKSLDLALKSNEFVEVVLWRRKRFLEECDLTEHIKRFNILNEEYKDSIRDDNIKQIIMQAELEEPQ